MISRLLRIQHRFNPLHVYCRLVERGLGVKGARSISMFYELVIWSWLSLLTVAAVRLLRRIK
jgi:hypothetical protein